jgi:hypothetical protein
MTTSLASPRALIGPTELQVKWETVSHLNATSCRF